MPLLSCRSTAQFDSLPRSARGRTAAVHKLRARAPELQEVSQGQARKDAADKDKEKSSAKQPLSPSLSVNLRSPAIEARASAGDETHASIRLVRHSHPDSNSSGTTDVDAEAMDYNKPLMHSSSACASPASSAGMPRSTVETGGHHAARSSSSSSSSSHASSGAPTLLSSDRSEPSESSVSAPFSASSSSSSTAPPTLEEAQGGSGGKGYESLAKRSASLLSRSGSLSLTFGIGGTTTSRRALRQSSAALSKLRPPVSSESFAFVSSDGDLDEDLGRSPGPSEGAKGGEGSAGYGGFSSRRKASLDACPKPNGGSTNSMSMRRGLSADGTTTTPTRRLPGSFGSSDADEWGAQCASHGQASSSSRIALGAGFARARASLDLGSLGSSAWNRRRPGTGTGTDVGDASEGYASPASSPASPFSPSYHHVQAHSHNHSYGYAHGASSAPTSPSKLRSALARTSLLGPGLLLRSPSQRERTGPKDGKGTSKKAISSPIRSSSSAAGISSADPLEARSRRSVDSDESRSNAAPPAGTGAGEGTYSRGSTPAKKRVVDKSLIGLPTNFKVSGPVSGDGITSLSKVTSLSSLLTQFLTSAEYSLDLTRPSHTHKRTHTQHTGHIGATSFGSGTGLGAGADMGSSMSLGAVDAAALQAQLADISAALRSDPIGQALLAADPARSSSALSSSHDYVHAQAHGSSAPSTPSRSAVSRPHPPAATAGAGGAQVMCNRLSSIEEEAQRIATLKLQAQQNRALAAAVAVAAEAGSDVEVDEDVGTATGLSQPGGASVKEGKEGTACFDASRLRLQDAFELPPASSSAPIKSLEQQQQQRFLASPPSTPSQLPSRCSTPAATASRRKPVPSLHAAAPDEHEQGAAARFATTSARTSPRASFDVSSRRTTMGPEPAARPHSASARATSPTSRRKPAPAVYPAEDDKTDASPDTRDAGRSSEPVDRTRASLASPASASWDSALREITMALAS